MKKISTIIMLTVILITALMFLLWLKMQYMSV